MQIGMTQTNRSPKFSGWFIAKVDEEEVRAGGFLECTYYNRYTAVGK